MLKDKVNESMYAHLLIEMGAIGVMSLMWFFVMSSISFFINEIMVPYKPGENIGSTWLWLVLEVVVTVIAFHFAVRLLHHLLTNMFKDYVNVKTLPEVHGSVLAAFALLIFQPSLQQRAKKVYTELFGPTRSDRANTSGTAADDQTVSFLQRMRFTN